MSEIKAALLEHNATLLYTEQNLEKLLPKLPDYVPPRIKELILASWRPLKFNIVYMCEYL